jgi:hypothetical protein
MYNEEASKYDASMATGFALLSIDKEGNTIYGPKESRMEASQPNPQKSMEDKGLIIRKIKRMDGVY